MTPRHGLRALNLSSPITQHGSEQLSRYLDRRAEEAMAVRNFVEENRDDNPTVIVGDFNMPFESSLYQHHWLGYQNAFNLVGVGYGYTFPCTRQYCWPGGMPWLRIDHILVDSAWTVDSCTVGTVNGSDHRLITATLSLP
jgi:endonuclease/exonuclease/phosphatase family metal-dependent hydrolase